MPINWVIQMAAILTLILTSVSVMAKKWEHLVKERGNAYPVSDDPNHYEPKWLSNDGVAPGL